MTGTGMSAKQSAKRPRSGWHYVSAGDYPPQEQSVIVYVADMSEWCKAVVSKGTKSTIGMYQQNSHYRGKAGGTDIDIWEGIPFHGAVIAWRDAGATPDGEKIKDTVLKFQRDQTQGENLKFLLASSYVIDPRKNEVYINGLMKKFRRNYKETTADGLVSHLGGKEAAIEAPVYKDNNGVSYTVEHVYDHGVIVQIDAPGGRSHIAKDFPRARRIYPTERDAATALMAEAERQKWKRVG